MTERLHYSMVVQWSDDDQAYLVTLPEWEGRVLNPVTHGDSYEQAIKRLATRYALASADGRPARRRRTIHPVRRAPEARSAGAVRVGRWR